jgi:hypothetical protein
VLQNNAVIRALKESRATFIFHSILCLAGIKGRINFLQMQRFLKKAGSISESILQTDLIFRRLIQP